MSSADAHDTAHGDHPAHPPHLAHHFDTPEQQFESGKLGMWVFLATEILMFGGLFCYYAYNRGNFPAVAEYSHHFLNPTWGAINTVVLLISSFTMAWGVRAAQLGQRSLLITMLVLTLVGAGMFMVIKAIEYSEKFGHDLYPGRYNLFSLVNNPPEGRDIWEEIHHLEDEYGFYGDHGHGGAQASAGEHAGQHAAGGAAAHGETAVDEQAKDEHAAEPGHAAPVEGATHGGELQSTEAAAQPEGPVAGREDPATGETITPQTAHLFTNPVEHSVILPASAGPAGTSAALLTRGVGVGSSAAAATELPVTFAQLSPIERLRVPSFFSVYYLMTGLHGIHVLIGIGLIGWILMRAIRNDFGPAYFTPVDIVGLYWHLVDLIWIFLFPLLYLID